MSHYEMIQPKTQHQPSPMSEAVLWRLYRRLLGEHLLARHLEQSARPGHSTRQLAAKPGSGIAAALSELLLDGDTVGLAADDVAARYLCGVPLSQLREDAQLRRPQGRRGNGGWAFKADAEHGLLPCTGEEQAAMAVGTALSARLHRSGSMTVLLCSSVPAGKAARKPDEGTGWAQAARTAIELELPLLFISRSPAAAGRGETETGRARPGPRRAAPSLPSIPVDRDDALALYRVIYESAARARTGGGPTWIECRAWALPVSPRTPSLLDRAATTLEQTALEKMEQALRSRRLFNNQQQRHLQHALEKEFAQAGWSPLTRP